MSNDEDSSLVPVDLIEEYAEIGADRLIEASKQYLPFLDDLGSEIPYVKTLVAAIKLPRSLSDFILGKKVYSFLFSSNIDQAKIEKFKKKFSKTKQERLWEQVVFSINAHDDRLKSEITGKLFSALVDDEISEEEFFTMVHATTSLNTHILDWLKRLYMLSYDNSLSASLYYNFVSVGLIDIDNSGIGAIGGGGPQYPLNQTGWKYVGIIYDYPDSSINGIKIGKEELVQEFNDEGQSTGQAFPLTYIKSKGSRYREVDLFMVQQGGEVLCSSEDGLPSVIGSRVTIAGEQPKKSAQDLASEYGVTPLSILLRKMEDTPVQKWVFIIKSDQLKEHTNFRSIADIRITINSISNKDDRIRYYVQILEQIERHVSGELRDVWDAQG